MAGHQIRNPDPFPVHTLKRVDQPTTIINEGQIKRIAKREAGFNRARLGEYGPVSQREAQRLVPKHLDHQRKKAIIRYPQKCTCCDYCKLDCPRKAIYVSPLKVAPAMASW
jgi:NAD-dependent dihydropyrimidine dehydrogenase PreA subunit